MGPRTNSSCCCQARNLSWAPVRLLMLLPGPECVMGPCTASHCCCLHRHNSAMCHFQVFSSHCWWFPFCHRVLLWPPIAAAIHRHTLWTPHSGFGPVDCPMSEVCDDSKIDGTHLHVILTVSIIFSSPADSKGI
ncbi:unnamed protein product [Staurois parvus]|uniref:Secreted protein n=1 Tax=Staurois parvus TaxID=386267 RepID=A0ABN9BBQ7_9NEOB|nr:unnamed protein product [Staurois parvus]